jgi:hypothetical protein
LKKEKPRHSVLLQHADLQEAALETSMDAPSTSPTTSLDVKSRIEQFVEAPGAEDEAVETMKQDDEFASLQDPGGHGEQAVAPSMLKNPEGQSRQTDEPVAPLT